LTIWLFFTRFGFFSDMVWLFFSRDVWQPCNHLTSSDAGYTVTHVSFLDIQYSTDRRKRFRFCLLQPCCIVLHRFWHAKN